MFDVKNCLMSKIFLTLGDMKANAKADIEEEKVVGRRLRLTQLSENADSRKMVPKIGSPPRPMRREIMFSKLA